MIGEDTVRFNSFWCPAGFHHVAVRTRRETEGGALGLASGEPKGTLAVIVTAGLAVVASVVMLAVIFGSQSPSSQKTALPSTSAQGQTNPPPSSGSSGGSTPQASGGSSGNTEHAALVVIQTQCEGCHTLWGKGGTVGPDLNQVFAGKLSKVPGGKPLDPTWLAAWITNPSTYLKNATMPPGLVSGSQLTAVVSYLEGIHSGTTKPPA